MTFDNIHIDHIKPVSKFNLNNTDEFYDCCHYTNLQPLLPIENLKNLINGIKKRKNIGMIILKETKIITKYLFKSSS